MPVGDHFAGKERHTDLGQHGRPAHQPSAHEPRPRACVPVHSRRFPVAHSLLTLLQPPEAQALRVLSLPGLSCLLT